MTVRIAREADGRVSLRIADSRPVVVTPIEARLLAIKLLLAAEELAASTLKE
jgi:hypothetical protein